MSRTLEIELPEGVTFSLLLAGPVSRFLAWCIDALVIASAMAAVVQVLGGVRTGRGWKTALGTLAYFVITTGYGIGMEWMWRGQTLGKRVLKLRVVDAHGLKLQPGQIVLRNALRLFDSLPVLYLAGGICMLLDGRGRRLGDIAGGTVVVRQAAYTAPDTAAFRGKFNSLLAYPLKVAQLRQSTSAETLEVAVQALLRREKLEPHARAELFHAIAARFQEVTNFPEEAVAPLTDEQFVRNVVEALMRRRSRARAESGTQMATRGGTGHAAGTHQPLMPE